MHTPQQSDSTNARWPWFVYKQTRSEEFATRLPTAAKECAEMTENNRRK